MRSFSSKCKPPCRSNDLEYLESRIIELTQCLDEYKREQHCKAEKKNSSFRKPLFCDDETCILNAGDMLEQNNPATRTCSVNSQIKILQKIERDLRNREAELLKKCNSLNKKIDNFKKCKKQKEKRDKITEKKLKLATKQIERALCRKSSSTTCLKKTKSKKKCKPKKSKNKKRDFHETLFRFIEWSVNPRDYYKNKTCNKNTSCNNNTCWNKNICINKDTNCEKKHSMPDSFFKNVFSNSSGRPEEKPCWSPFQMAYPCKCDAFKRLMMEKKAMKRSMRDDCFMRSLRAPPQPWIYDQWPNAYPYYLSARMQFKLLGRSLMFVLAALFWTPCLLCLLCFYICCCQQDCC